MLGHTCRRVFFNAFRLSIRNDSTKAKPVFPGEHSEIRGDGAIRRTEPLGSTVEQTYAGVLSFLRRNYSRNLKNVDVAVTGIPLDLATTYRPGARFGPKGIREASVQLAELKSYPGGIDLFEELSVIDYGDCWFDGSQPTTISSSIMEHAKKILERHTFLLALGGDHYMTYPLLKAHFAQFKKPLSLVHFAAHCDTWPDKHPHSLNHDSILYHAIKEGLVDAKTSIHIGIRTFNDDYMGVKTLDASWVQNHKAAEVAQEIQQRVGNNLTYLTFNIDCLDPAFAPGTGAPVCGGLSSGQAIDIIRSLTSLNYAGMDIVEVSPPYDHSIQTSLAAATIGYELLLLLRHKKIVDKNFHFGAAFK